VTDKESYNLVLSGAQKGLSIYKNWLGLTAIEMDRMK
jgi:hypothetical protein